MYGHCRLVICSSIYPYNTSIHLYVCPLIHLSIDPCIHLSIYVSIYQTMYPLLLLLLPLIILDQYTVQME